MEKARRAALQKKLRGRDDAPWPASDEAPEPSSWPLKKSSVEAAPSGFGPSPPGDFTSAAPAAAGLAPDGVVAADAESERRGRREGEQRLEKEEAPPVKLRRLPSGHARRHLLSCVALSESWNGPLAFPNVSSHA